MRAVVWLAEHSFCRILLAGFILELLWHFQLAMALKGFSSLLAAVALLLETKQILITIEGRSRYALCFNI